MTCAIARHFVNILHAGLPAKDNNLTGSGRVLSEILLLVPAEEALGLRLRSRTTGELAVEVDHSLHADSICCGTKTLLIIGGQSTGIYLILRFSFDLALASSTGADRRCVTLWIRALLVGVAIIRIRYRIEDDGVCGNRRSKLTLGDAICCRLSVRLFFVAKVEAAYLGRDECGKGATEDERHDG